jgi:CubicO group peptidase (beta-lactamase class C family)
MKKAAILFLSIVIFLPSMIYGQENKNPGISLHMAALQGNVAVIKQYIKAGSDLNMKDQFGSTPLAVAITFGKTEAAKALIDAGANLTIRDNYGSTPLHLAAFFGRTEIVKALLDKGVDRYLRNNDGVIAYDIAASPFDYDKATYDKLGKALAPLGLVLDYEQLRSSRPKIAKLLKSSVEGLKEVDYTPIVRNDWKVSTPAEQKLDPMLVAELYLDAAHLETIYGLLVIKNGYLVAEKYFNKGSVDQLSKRASVTKSYISALLGIALEKGCLKSIDQKMIDFFPEVADKINDPRKKQITIKEMLQMRGGYPWEETDSTYWNAIWSGRYINKITDIPLTKDPGTEFQYSNLTSNWLGIIISRACNTDLKTFGEEYLFNPLKVKLGDWNRDLDGYYIGSGDIQFTARDMAKFGLLYLNEGKYNGKQLIPSDWVKASLQSYSEKVNTSGVESGRVGRYFHDMGYGYQWWSATVGSRHFNFAWGHGGQLIILLNDPDMVIVVTADPFYGKEKHFNSWKYEKSIINLVGKFIKSLPME